MKRKSATALLLTLALLLALAPPPASAADDDSAYATSTAKAVQAAPPDLTGLIKFDDVVTVTIDPDGGSPTSSTTTITEALNTVCKDATGQQLSYIAYVSVPATQGTIYDGYNSEADTGAGVAGNRKYYYSASASNYLISNIQFVPNASFTGRAAISYYGYTVGSQPTTYSGHIYITVNKQQPSITYSTDGEPVKLYADDFVTYSLAVTGRTFRYITFTLPSASKGTLYYNYRDEAIYDSVVAGGERYYRSSNKLLDNVYFVPAGNNSDTEMVEIPFSGVDIGGGSVTGTMYIKVTAYGPEHAGASGGAFTYTVEPGRSVYVDNLSDFTTFCTDELGSGYAFSRIRLMDLPSSSEGTLYYGGGTTEAKLNTDYYGASYPYLTSLRFEASYTFEGTAAVPFRAYATQGGNTRFCEGTLTFEVKTGASTPLHYTVAPGKRVFFENSDFTSVARSAMGSSSLSRIRFTDLPPSSRGTLYYMSGSGTVTSVTTGSDYSSGNLSGLNFLAADGFAGSVTIPFIGYSYSSYYSSAPSWGKTFSGTVTITSTVAASEDAPSPAIGGTPSLLTYYSSGPAVSLRSYEIQNAAAAVLPGTPSTVVLTRPDGTAGRLCLDFVSPSNYADFDSSRSYAVSDLSRVSFLPKAGFSGSTRISYTVSDARGNSFMGNIVFVVTKPTSSSYFSDMSSAVWAIPSVDFFRYYGATNGTTRTSFGPSADMKRGDFILLLSRAFNYPAAGSESFADVPAEKYYAAAIASAKSLGIVTDGDAVAVPNPEYVAALEANPNARPRVPATISGFDPAGAISREDAALYLYRSLRRSGRIEPGSADYLARFPDAADVSAGAVEAMGALVREGIFEGYSSGLLPRKTLTRAETMAILHRALT